MMWRWYRVMWIPSQGRVYFIYFFMFSRFLFFFFFNFVFLPQFLRIDNDCNVYENPKKKKFSASASLHIRISILLCDFGTKTTKSRAKKEEYHPSPPCTYLYRPTCIISIHVPEYVAKSEEKKGKKWHKNNESGARVHAAWYTDR